MKIIKHLTYLTLFILLVSACKKDDTTSEQWSTKAQEKRDKIDQLIASEKCENLNDWSIEKVAYAWCGHTYFPVHKRIKKQFEKLWDEYRALQSKAIDAGIKEGVIYEPCEEYVLLDLEPIQLVCENEKAKLLYIKDLSLADSKTQIITVRAKIDTYLANLTCTGKEQWDTFRLIKECGYEYIPYIRTNEASSIKKEITRYNSLKVNIIEREKTPCQKPENVYAKEIKCVNNKPVVVLSK